MGQLRRAYFVRASSCPILRERDMTEPVIEQTEDDVLGFTEELSDEALDRTEAVTVSSGCVCGQNR